ERDPADRAERVCPRNQLVYQEPDGDVAAKTCDQKGKDRGRTERGENEPASRELSPPGMPAGSNKDRVDGETLEEHLLGEVIDGSRGQMIRPQTSRRRNEPPVGIRAVHRCFPIRSRSGRSAIVVAGIETDECTRDEDRRERRNGPMADKLPDP